MPNYDAYRYDKTARRVSGTRWATDEEIRESLEQVNMAAPHYGACGLPLISDGRIAYVNNSDSHALIMGSTGSKKSRLFVMPMMQIIARAGESVVVNDPKGELYERTSGLFKREGYDIQVINLRTPLRSNGWNPIRYAYELYHHGHEEEATSLINDLSTSIFRTKANSKIDPFWEQMSQAVFQGLCHTLIEGDVFPKEHLNFESLITLATNLTGWDCPDYSEGLTNKIAKTLPPHSMALTNLSAVRGSEKTFDNIMVSYNAPMQALYSRRALIRMMSCHQVDFNRLGKRKSALFIIMPDEKTTLHFLVSLIVKQCYEALIELAQKSKGLTLPVRVNFLLDEFSNLPSIPDMSSMISAARSRNIRFYLVVQSMHQLISKYGEEANTIRGNCNDWVFLTSRELVLLKELEELCGVNARTGEALISVSQLQRLNKETGEALVLCGRNYPYIAHLADIDDYPFSHLPPKPLPRIKNAEPPALDLEELYNAIPGAKKVEEEFDDLPIRWDDDDDLDDDLEDDTEDEAEDDAEEDSEDDIEEDSEDDTEDDSEDDTEDDTEDDAEEDSEDESEGDSDSGDDSPVDLEDLNLYIHALRKKLEGEEN